MGFTKGNLTDTYERLHIHKEEGKAVPVLYEVYVLMTKSCT